MGGGRGEGVEGAALTQGTQAWIMIIKRKLKGGQIICLVIA